MIEEETINEIQSDYLNSYADRETLPQLQHNNTFWRWFGEQALIYNALKSNNLFSCLEDYRCAGRCFGNAQTVVFRQQITYCEGFMLLGEKGYHLHGFNLIGIEVLDFTVTGNPDIFNEFMGYPTAYYGVVIPADFVRAQYSNGEPEKYSNSPLLWKYYLAST